MLTRQKRLYLTLGILGFLLGVAWGSLFEVNSWFILVLLIDALILAMLGCLKYQDQKTFFCLASVFLVCLSVGVARFNYGDKPLANLDGSLGQKNTFTVTVVAEPKEKEGETKLTVTPAGYDLKILITTDRYPKYEYGDKLKVAGKLDRPENFATKAGTTFDYISYLAKDDVYYQLYKPQIEIISTNRGLWGVGGLIKLKNKFLDHLALAIPEPEASLAGGLVIGGSGNLGQTLSDKFRVAGVSHIIVLSGYNITVVANSILQIFSFMPRLGGLTFGALGILIFSLMVGGGPTVVRAAIMALLVIVAKASGRVYDAAIALVAAATGMVFFNPRILVFDLSFQLSFLATIGVVFAAPVIAGRLGFITERFGFREAASTTLGAQLLVLPWIVYKMGQLSLVGFFANIFILPLVPTAMLFGFITGVTGFIALPLSLPFGYISYFLLKYIVLIVELFSSLPLAAVEIKSFPLIFVILIYFFYLWLVYRQSLSPQALADYNINKDEPY